MLYDMQGYLKDNVQKYLAATGLRKEQLRAAKTPFIDESTISQGCTDQVELEECLKIVFEV